MKPRKLNSLFSGIVGLVLAVTVMTALAACGSNSAEPTDASEPEAAAETKTESAPAEETTSGTLDRDAFESESFKGFGNIKGFAGTTFKHGTFDTREFEGKPLVVNFWFPSCPPCRAELGYFESVYQKFGPPAGGEIQFVGVQQLGIDTIEDGAALFDELGVSFPGLPDTDSGIQIAYNVFSFPSTVFLDKNHNRYRVWQGAIDEEQLTEIVQELADGATALNEDGTPVEVNDDAAEQVMTDEATESSDEPAEPEIVYADTEVFSGIGDAPGFKGDTFHHGSFDLNNFEGKPVVINFWYPSCPPCRAEIPNFEHAYQTWGEPGKNQIVFVGVQAVAFDTAAEGVEFLQTMKATYPAIPDVGSSIHIAYQITAAPTTFFLDRDHNVLSVHQGYIQHNQLQDILVQMVEA